MAFADKSRQLRKEKNISQYELAEFLGVSKACISMIEIGKNEPTANTLIRYANYFQCSVDYLLEREDDFGNISVQSEGPNLTAEEQQLLNDFRTLPRPERAQATEYIHYLADKRGIKNKHA